MYAAVIVDYTAASVEFQNDHDDDADEDDANTTVV